ncbi:Lrp/AsnC family transcriptional regulator [Sphingomonas sp. R-74633]|uniref:Lrp/AsnC family transcriptional regulator n=1 Tax=Sphingomonas sp. R-74633 TaxID=2751188 RepID=UPI0015D41C97|nr:Lrp/AsnC family transcriptional regulator [Sphingomonas sp. R-74633]NYT39152.1 Lrp/AsnC family transcriptional regulator [Sphingomonas sp. R-74633]
MTKIEPLDSFDRKLLELLQLDVHQPVAALAEKVGLSAPACYRRMRRLREAGVIEREIAVVRPKTLGWPLSMIVLVSLERENANTVAEMFDMFRAEPAVIEAWNVTGDHDFAVRIIARDMESYDDLVRRMFSAHERVRTFETLVVIRETGTSPVPVA